MADVSVVVVTYDALPWVERCLESVRRFETIVGSGVIIEKDGQILTNAHVVDGAASLTVTLDSGNRVTARILGLDPVLDLALLRVDFAVPVKTELDKSWHPHVLLGPDI